MIRPNDVIDEARSWVGTRFHHGGRVKGVGVDCVGLVVCVAAALGIKPHDRAAYPLRPNGELKPFMERFMVRVGSSVDDAALPDVLLMAFDKEPHHLAFYAGATIIHAYAQARKCVEQPMHDYWRARTVGVYRWSGFLA